MLDRFGTVLAILAAVVVLFLFARVLGLGFLGGLSNDPGPGPAAEAGGLPASEFDQRIPCDGIRPIYDPEFIPAAQAGLGPSKMVMAVEINGEARAYPISVLNSREIVNDVVGGRPILVTW